MQFLAGLKFDPGYVDRRAGLSIPSLTFSGVSHLASLRLSFLLCQMDVVFSYQSGELQDALFICIGVWDQRYLAT